MDASFYFDMGAIALIVLVSGLALGEAIVRHFEKRDGTGCP